MFWIFAHEVSKRAAKKWNQDVNGLENLVWSNLCKIGQIRGNPSDKLVDEQFDLAVETLRLEIQTYGPKIVLFVTDEYADSIINETIYDPKRRSLRDQSKPAM
jgi:hypothetical protein